MKKIFKKGKEYFIYVEMLIIEPGFSSEYAKDSFQQVFNEDMDLREATQFLCSDAGATWLVIKNYKEIK